MTIYMPPSMKRFTPRRPVFSTWVDHVPFGFDIIEAVKPKLLVELGSYNGLSYFTFCQSMIENEIDGLCYAVDTWKGDKHTEEYDDSIYQGVAQHNREFYWGFSYLLRMLFSEALNHFENETIDLLHIDGLHTYEAVKNDFETWYPKLRPGGIIIFHDIAARIKDFGVWKFWDEIKTQYPTFHFNQGFGLGVLYKPGKEIPDHPLLQAMFNSDAETQHSLRDFYTMASRHILLKKKAEGSFGGARKEGPEAAAMIAKSQPSLTAKK